MDWKIERDHVILDAFATRFKDVTALEDFRKSDTAKKNRTR